MKNILKKLIASLLILWQLFYCPALYAQEVIDPSPTPSDQSITNTGDATSFSDTTSITNTSLIDSNIVTHTQTIDATVSADINLQDPLQKSVDENATDLPVGTISAIQEASVSSQTLAASDTGNNNTVATQSSDLQTGDALAVSNSITATNLNLISSNVVSTVINIIGDLTGDIILPNPELLAKPVNFNTINFTSSQQATVTSSTTSEAATGNNTQIAEKEELTTGDTDTLATSTTLTNMSNIGQSLSFLTINNSGLWNGSLINWDSPGSTQILGAGLYNLATASSTPAVTCTSDCSTTIISNQVAQVESSVVATANTGNNTQIAINATASTGNAIAIANNITLTNITGVGSGLFVGILNILGNWTGNLVVAYPKLNINITDNKDTIAPNSPNTYFMTISNTGKARANNLTSTFTPPTGFNTNSILTYQEAFLDPGQSKTYPITGTIEGKVGDTLTAKGVVHTTSSQESQEKNESSDTTFVINEDVASENTTLTPDLSLNIATNVHDFVYPGDTLRVYVTLTNNSSFTASNTTLRGHLSGPPAIPSIPLEIKTGNIPAYAKVKIEFTISLQSFLASGTYTLNLTSANAYASSSFLVKTKNLINNVITPPVQAKSANVPEGQVLGASTTNYNVDSNSKMLYIIIGLAITYLITQNLKMKIKTKS